MNTIIDWRGHVGSRSDKFFKAILFDGEFLLVGLNCLDANQTQSIHAHDGADKFYFVLEGRGQFVVGEEELEAREGMLIVAPAGIPHGVSNIEKGRLSLLVGIAPASR
ncbi:MAG TPA: cupin domain-containing protein [Pyrinomonadaceae bacterium]|nr:cupin domain-containing protein [Pyrinomonadaceae bacterium]